MNFYKSLAVAGSVTGTILAAVLVTGLLTNQQMDLDVGVDDPQVLRIQAVPVRLGGYGIKHKRDSGEIVVLSITLKVDNSLERELVCRLAPRLVATVTRDITQRYTNPEALTADLGKTLPDHLRRRFNQALKSNIISHVGIRKLAPDEGTPRSTCGPGG